jgi:hypothetical protein
MFIKISHYIGITKSSGFLGICGKIPLYKHGLLQSYFFSIQLRLDCLTHDYVSLCDTTMFFVLFLLIYCLSKFLFYYTSFLENFKKYINLIHYLGMVEHLIFFELHQIYCLSMIYIFLWAMPPFPLPKQYVPFPLLLFAFFLPCPKSFAM